MPDRSTWRRWVNNANLSTPLGRGLARLGRAEVHPWRDGVVVAAGHRLPFPDAPAFTMGNVVLVRSSFEDLVAFDAQRPTLMEHELRHSSQYALCLGPVMVPLYLGACAWSWVRTGDWWSRNAFERRAGLADGGYVERPLRREHRRAGGAA